MRRTILFVEDDKEFSEYTRDLLIKQGYLVESALKGSEALSVIKRIIPDLVILDLKLPDIQGESVCQEIRKQHPQIPIIILSAKNETFEKVKGLNYGANDYVTKPFIPEEFLARVRACMRIQNNQQTVLKVADLELDSQRIQVKRAGKEISLTPQEFKLLEYLMHNPGVVLSREMILNRVWSYSFDVESRVVDVYMGYLRKKIDAGFKNRLIHSVRGFGYTLKDPQN